MHSAATTEDKSDPNNDARLTGHLKERPMSRIVDRIENRKFLFD